MAIKESLLPEYDHEMGTTRKLLERVPLGEVAWKPHAKSMTMGELVTHIVSMPGWVGSIVDESSFDVAQAGEPPKSQFSSTGDLLSTFDQNVAKARSAIASKSDAEMMAPWTLKKGDQELFTVPRVGVLRSFLLNHLIHHRGQLSVYLRMKDVPIPPIYGPSADEGAF